MILIIKKLTTTVSIIITTTVKQKIAAVKILIYKETHWFYVHGTKRYE